MYYILAIALFLPLSLHARSKGGPSPVAEFLAAEPKDFETCFAPDEPCATKLAKFIMSAKTSLDVAIYDINQEQVVHAILVQSKKIPTRVVVDRRQSKGNHSKVDLLIKAGVKVRFGRQRGIMHNKFAIVDRKRIVTGSFNFTNHASTSNQENQIYLNTQAVVQRFSARYDQMWAEASEGSP